MRNEMEIGLYLVYLCGLRRRSCPISIFEMAMRCDTLQVRSAMREVVAWKIRPPSPTPFART